MSLISFLFHKTSFNKLVLLSYFWNGVSMICFFCFVHDFPSSASYAPFCTFYLTLFNLPLPVWGILTLYSDLTYY